jgi:hypothetical protein
MKEIHECTDGRGCVHLNGANCMRNGDEHCKIYRWRDFYKQSNKSFHYFGCESGYQEKPPEQELKERIVTWRPPLTKIFGKKYEDEYTQLLRDIGQEFFDLGRRVDKPGEKITCKSYTMGFTSPIQAAFDFKCEVLGIENK